MPPTRLDDERARLILVFPETWLDRRAFEWLQLSEAACQAGFAVVITHWGALEAEGARVRARSARVRDTSSGAITIRDVEFRPDVFLTTWGVDAPFRRLFARIIGASGAVHKESPTLARLDDKAELERCIRRWEQQTAGTVPRPLTLLSSEATERDVMPAGEVLIVKPARGGKRRGIRIAERSQIVSLARQVADGQYEPFVVQELIDSGLLYQGRRWVMRVHAMCTSMHPLSYHLYRDGWATTASREAIDGSLELDQWLNPTQDLDGSTVATVLPLSRMLEILDREYFDFSSFWPRMEVLVHNLFEAIAMYEHEQSSRYQEEERELSEAAVLFPGLDLVVRRRASEDDFELSLLELNSHPGLGDGPETAGAMLPYYRTWFEDLIDLVERRAR